jgi:probable rRNA maturation factor
MNLIVDFKDEQDIYEVRVAMKAIVRKAIFNTLVYEGFDKDVEVSVTFTDNEQIKDLNSQYRNKNTATDVLSFPMFDDLNNALDLETLPLGDIVISLERAAIQGYHLCHSIYHEVAFLTEKRCRMWICCGKTVQEEENWKNNCYRNVIIF